MTAAQSLNLDVQLIVELHHSLTRKWHHGSTSFSKSEPWYSIERNHRMNFDLWHEEDIARRDDLGAEKVRLAKRKIDRFNQARNDAMEQIDIWVKEQLANLQSDSDSLGILHSETPGMIIDRLSILSLKQYHMQEQTQREEVTVEHRQRCLAKLQIIEEQLSDLSSCLHWLLEQLSLGKRRFKLYKQLKMYNDPTLNPQLYPSTSSLDP